MEAKFITLNDGVNALSNQKYCGFALAHPAWPYLPNIMKKPEFYLDAMKQYIKTFANLWDEDEKKDFICTYLH